MKTSTIDAGIGKVRLFDSSIIRLIRDSPNQQLLFSNLFYKTVQAAVFDISQFFTLSL